MGVLAHWKKKQPLRAMAAMARSLVLSLLLSASLADAKTCQALNLYDSTYHTGLILNWTSYDETTGTAVKTGRIEYKPGVQGGAVPDEFGSGGMTRRVVFAPGNVPKQRFGSVNAKLAQRELAGVHAHNTCTTASSTAHSGGHWISTGGGTQTFLGGSVALDDATTCSLPMATAPEHREGVLAPAAKVHLIYDDGQ
eukprot:g7445.t1